jgi:SAM-dependent methyltransferase
MSQEIPRSLALGCGTEKPDGFYGVDIVETEEVDLVQDLDEPGWDLPTNHFSTIRAIDLFEHLENPIQFMEELYRIAKPEANILIQGPHISSDNWHDPTHQRLLGSRTFEHFTEDTRFDFYSEARFEVIDFEITFEWFQRPLYKKISKYIANNYPNLYERYFFKNLFPATNIQFQLTPIK